jgi:UDP-N-acetylglucosamine--N-acetylmuramyl-(pentapeptide) pyrophosphoryl-undecaprenol N-acetylglucosamine transferase
MAILQALKASDHEILWVGSQAGMENALVQRSGYRFAGIPSAGLHGVGIKALPGNILRLLKGLRDAGRLIRDFKPDALLLTGGYVSIPVAIAGRKLPSLLFVPDIEPGQAIQLIARFASRIAVSTPESLPFFKSSAKVIVTGYPTRSELTVYEKDAARQKLGLSTDKNVLMFFGGSQGALSMNRSLYPLLPDILQRFQVIHLCGENNWAENQAEADKLPAGVRKDYHPHPFLHAEKMALAFSAADIAVSRGGAGGLGEFPLFGLPAILVPYPYAWRYQQVNASYLEKQGAARIIQDADLRNTLKTTLFELFDYPQKLAEMAQRMRSLANPAASRTIAEELEALPVDRRKAGAHDRS